MKHLNEYYEFPTEHRPLNGSDEPFKGAPLVAQSEQNIINSPWRDENILDYARRRVYSFAGSTFIDENLQKYSSIDTTISQPELLLDCLSVLVNDHNPLSDRPNIKLKLMQEVGSRLYTADAVIALLDPGFFVCVAPTEPQLMPLFVWANSTSPADIYRFINRNDLSPVFEIGGSKTTIVRSDIAN